MVPGKWRGMPAMIAVTDLLVEYTKPGDYKIDNLIGSILFNRNEDTNVSRP
jgi:hypothetical protein